MLFSLGYILTLSMTFIKRKNIAFIYSNKIMNNPFINLSEIEFTFAFGVQYSDNSFSSIEDMNLYFNYSIELIEWIGKDNLILMTLGKRKNSSDFPKFMWMN